jgi:hypothetical protein
MKRMEGGGERARARKKKKKKREREREREREGKGECHARVFPGDCACQRRGFSVRAFPFQKRERETPSPIKKHTYLKCHGTL